MARGPHDMQTTPGVSRYVLHQPIEGIRHNSFELEQPPRILSSATVELLRQTRQRFTNFVRNSALRGQWLASLFEHDVGLQPFNPTI